MRNHPLLYSFMLLFTFISLHADAQSDWEFRKEKDSIRVYTRDAEDTNVKELKIITWVRSSLAGALKVVNDIPNFPSWVYKCEEGRMLEEGDSGDFYYYNRSDFPWPFADRDFVMRCTTYQDTSTLVLYTRSSAAPDRLPENNKTIRVAMTQSNWTFQPLPGGYIEVEYYLKSDPGGKIPAWLINMALDVGPLYSLKKYRTMVEREEFRDMRSDWIRELGE